MDLYAQESKQDTLLTDSNYLNPSKDALNSAVNYHFDDSSYFDSEKKEFHLWGNAHIDYEKINLNAGYILINFGNNTITAMPSKDSLGSEQNYPIFNDGDRDYKCEKMMYNFSTKKGKIFGLFTKEGDGFIHGTEVKKDSLDQLMVKNAKYTTCDDSLHPHFYISAKKLKIIPGKQIVSGPAQVYVADVPTPAVLPFGFFPIKKGQRRGLLAPGFANSLAQGYYIKGLGYYFPINDYIDLAIKADIYFNGSIQGTIAQQYRKNYRFNGMYTLSYGNMLFGDRKADDFRRNRNFNLTWRHVIDPKAIPGYTFNLDINLASSNYYQTSSLFNINDITKNIVRSSVSFGKNDSKNRYNITAALNHDQNLQTHDLNITFPEINFTYNSFAPLARKKMVGTQKWYEQIRIGYNMNSKNTISTKDTLLTQNPDTIFDLMKNGISHRVPLNFPTIKLFKFLNVSPTADYSEFWYFKTIEKVKDTGLNNFRTIENNNFKRSYTYGFQASVNTAIYGLLNINRFNLVAISHIIRPTITFGYRPDFSADRFGFYKYYRPDSSQYYPSKYSIFERGIYGGPGSGEQGFMSFSINNNIEAKYKKKTDTGYVQQKTSIIDNLSINTYYNFLADSFKLSNIDIFGSTKLLKRYSITFGASIDPYQYTTRKLDIYDIDLLKLKFGHLSNARFALSTSFSADDFKPKKKETKTTSNEELNYLNSNPDILVDFSIPWTLNLSYTFNYFNNPLALTDKQVYKQALMISGEMTITKNWRVGVSTGYDIQLKQSTFSTINIYRELHCWMMSFDWVPTGTYRRYVFTLKAKSSLLQDLKLNKRREWFDK